ncbi:Hypothetical protein PENO1_012210 [Penicillium occitanis (nom. inval.)]|nr:hypothetical protein PENOC_058210 [Penicillium occitanis (nom. inval.)]PCH07321.1 Hypothetical protein PENO1_012210 [Penicillium occitanis (nom. inval.)]
MAEIASPSAPVEARSLSSITSIAANPPAYPRNPTQAKLDRVELYIVKSNISIEAINSSLYYLHVATDEDEDVLRSIESEQREHPYDALAASRLSNETVSRLNDFHRKPVSGQDASTTPYPPPPPPHREGVTSYQTQSANDENNPRIPRKNVHDSYSYSPITQPNQNTASRDFAIPRRPVSSGNMTLVTPTSTELNTGQRFSYDGLRPSVENIRPHQSHVPEDLSPGDILTNQNLGSPFRITLIRRDAASGNQWNVATMSSSREDKGVIHVEISNPGYVKFMNNVRLSSNTSGQHLTAGEGQNAAEVLKRMAQNMMHDDDSGKRIFYRDITPVKHDHASHSLSEVLFNRHSGSAETPKLAEYVSAKVNRGYYSFKSPWGGTCSFVASVNGGSLKCKHTIPGPAMSGEAGLSGSGQSPEVTVSELRYNIPFALEQSFRPPSILNVNGNSKSPEDRGKGKRAALSQLITTNIQKVQQHARSRSHSQGGMHTPSLSVARGSGDEQSPALVVPADDEDRLDFSLAREHGGGGMSGKSAKLGKLIIEDEGIKMIDLVVAASMGVWWRSTYQPS